MLRTRDVKSGYWLLAKKTTRVRIRPSVVSNTKPPREYATDQVYDDFEDSDRHLLNRAYQKLVLYYPWQDSPDKSFLDRDTENEL